MSQTPAMTTAPLRASPARTAQQAAPWRRRPDVVLSGTGLRWRPGEIVELHATDPRAASDHLHRTAAAAGALHLSHLLLDAQRPLIAAIAAPAWVRGTDAALAYHRAAAAADAVGLAAWFAEPLTTLDPVGQRLATVAAALACRPALLLADRPDAGLPAATLEHLRAAFEHAAAQGVAVLFSAAQPALAAVAHRRVVVEATGDRR